MSQYFAAAVARSGPGWVGRELDLVEVTDFDFLVDELCDLTEGTGAALLFVEEDDEYVGIVRVDGDREPRCFLSDSRVTSSSAIAAMLGDNLDVSANSEVDDEPLEESVTKAGAVASGDAHLLADFGVPAAELLDLCGRKGMLPADVITALAERIGFLETMEELRGV